MGTFGLPAPPTPPPTPPQPSEEDVLIPDGSAGQIAHMATSKSTALAAQSITSRHITGAAEKLRSAATKGCLSNVARLSATRSEDARGSPGLQSAESIPPSPPKLAEKCSTRLRLADRLDLANAADSSCSGETEYHPQPWSLPVADANRAPGTSTNSTTSSARSLKLSCKDSLDGTTAAPASVGEAPNRASQLVQHVAAQVTAKELAELRSFRNPPAVVCQVLEVQRSSLDQKRDSNV
ncbi:Dual-specificity RNA methyltransferase RlmN 1 [Durusdinium trenchii]|uniref:Dual-specificity RNA methyltransferase RlmN 1 n=1 Tax=Durusdinium trenchii TaxID=1381693 RepID=A0ABP0S0M4_9DINO